MSFEWVSYFACEECGLGRPPPEVPYDQLGYAVCPGCGAETRLAVAAMADASTSVDGWTPRASRPFTGMSWTGVRRNDHIVEWERSDGHATIRLQHEPNAWHVRVDRLHQSAEGHGYEGERFESEAEARETVGAWRAEYDADG